jgi:hypothetical protein
VSVLMQLLNRQVKVRLSACLVESPYVSPNGVKVTNLTPLHQQREKPALSL